MNLDIGTKIGRYEIRSLLGAGGMGEVYRAFDSLLEREVALKFLKHTDDAEKLRRFRQEAKAVSALNHPNILTIYEVGEFENHPFIVSELINGVNLRECITGKTLSLGEILDIGIQIGNALAAAHADGIVHRDIKPENIMVLPDGYIKVLDFGLAKFIGLEKNFAADYDASTASLIQTKAGMIIGTVNYMSPEQLRGKPVDALTDVWSLGVVLFEMLADRRPFTGESVSDVIASILEHPLPEISRFNAGIPQEVEIIVSKALEKKKEQRFQTAREFVSELKNAKAVFGNGNRAIVDSGAFSESFHSQKTFFTQKDEISATAETKNLSGLFIGGTRVRWRVLVLIGALFAATLAVGGWRYFYRPLAKQPTVVQGGQINSRRLTTTGNVTNGALSPDGRFYVLAQEDYNGRQSLWLRQTDGTAANELIPANFVSYSGLTFTPDGNWIYYTIFGGSETGRLYRIALLGGEPHEIARDVDSAASFAPDGKKLAFVRSNPKEGVNRIIILNEDGSDERILAEKSRPEFYTIAARESISWSPDGKSIACPFGRIGTSDDFMSVAEINVETGAENPLTTAKWYRVGRVLWTKNPDELLITAAEFGSDLYQIVKVFRSTGTSKKMTFELNDYYNLSLNDASTLLFGVSYDKTSHVYTASREDANQIKQITGGGYDGFGGVLWTPDGQIIYVSTESGNRDIWKMDADGKNQKPLTFDKGADSLPSISKDGKYIAYVSARAGIPHVWRMNTNGIEQKQLTDKGGEDLPSIAPDGSYVIYSSRTAGPPTLWKVFTNGGEPVQLTKEATNAAVISPDGKFIACLMLETAPVPQTKLAIISAETGTVLSRFKTMGTVMAPMFPATIRWLPDGQALTYVVTAGGVSNVWLQPVNGDEPKKITDFKTDRIFSFDWTGDGKKIVYARGMLRNDLVLIENF